LSASTSECENKEENLLVEIKYLCACNKCYQVYHYKDANGTSFGTKNMKDHQVKCVSKSLDQTQSVLSQFLVKKCRFLVVTWNFLRGKK